MRKGGGDSMERNASLIQLDNNYVLRVQKREQGVQGEVVLVDRSNPHRGTHVFNTPEQGDVQELVAWSHKALQAYREG